MKKLLVTAPTIEPITVSELKRYLRLDDSEGEPSPVALTAALGSVAGNLSAGAYRYRLTFVTADGETEGGTISSSVTVSDPAVAGKISLTSIPLGGSAVTSRKIYRTTAGGSTYLLLTTISDNTTATYTDNIADGSLGAGCPTTNTTEDPELGSLITCARMSIEELCDIAFLTQTWDRWISQFPSNPNYILLPYCPLQSVSSITYVDINGDTQTWSSGDYTVNIYEKPGFIVPGYDETYPDCRGHESDIKIRFVAGYGDSRSDVPEPLKMALKIFCAHLYENRGIISFTSLQDIPWNIQLMLDQYRNRRMDCLE